MSFITDFLNKKIVANMEDPEEREQRWERRLRAVHAASQSARERMELPTKPWGFWRNEKNNAKWETNVDPAISKLPGRAKVDLSSSSPS